MDPLDSDALRERNDWPPHVVQLTSLYPQGQHVDLEDRGKCRASRINLFWSR